MAQDAPLLSFENVSKDFFGNTVLHDICFDLKPGEILGLVGENGAGKTTLMRILFGMPVIAETGGYEGRVCIDGAEVSFKSPFDALDAGIGMVHQEFSLIPGFTTTENILLNRESMKPSLMNDVFGDRMSILDRAGHAQARAGGHRASSASTLDPDMLVSEMPVGHKQFTEIAREINREKTRILVLDEPTAVLTETEAEVLLTALRNLARQGIAMIFISHRLHEVVSRRRPDRRAARRPAREGHPRGGSVGARHRLVDGRPRDGRRARRRDRATGTSARSCSAVEHLWVDMPGETVRDMSFSVRKGEIFGIGGLAGQGKLGIPNGIMGLFPAGGTVRLGGKPVPLDAPRAALQMGMGFVSEDRRGVGLLLDESLEWNIAFTAMQIQEKHLRPLLGGLIKMRDERSMRALTEEYVTHAGHQVPGPAPEGEGAVRGQPAEGLPRQGLRRASRDLLFVSEPTRGIDVGAKKLVLDALHRYNREYGTTIVMISSELEELRSICDRIAIVDEGRIAGILPPHAELSEFGLLMAGERAAQAQEDRGA